MKYKIGDKVYINNRGIEDYDDEDLSFLKAVVCTIVAYSSKEEYPYGVEVPPSEWKSSCTMYSEEPKVKITFNGTCFKEHELDPAFELTEQTKKEIMKKEYKIGDRVYFNGNQDGLIIEGYGKVIEFLSSNKNIGIEFDNPNGKMHSCYGKGKERYCYYIDINSPGLKSLESHGVIDDVDSRVAEMDYIMSAHQGKPETKDNILEQVDLVSTVGLIKRRSKNVGFKSTPLKSTI